MNIVHTCKTYYHGNPVQKEFLLVFRGGIVGRKRSNDLSKATWQSVTKLGFELRWVSLKTASIQGNGECLVAGNL